MNNFPYTNFHELNLDWFMGEFKKLVAEWEETKGEWNTLHDYVQNYFNNLNVQTEIDNKINAMIADGTFADIVSPFVQTDKVEDINIGNFSSDIDYMSIAPDNFSKDGFVLLMAKTDTQTGEKYIPFYYYQDMENHTQIVQNWYASLQYLILHFLRSDLPAWTFNYGDDTDYEAYGIQRQKKQQVQIPVGDTTPDLMKLVRTAMGDGQVERMSINLSSRMAKTTLKYDTYAEE